MIQYSSVNFRDVMIRNGKLKRKNLITGYGSDGSGFGLDFAGYVEESRRVKVIGLGRNCIANKLLRQPKYLTWELREDDDLEKYATVACAYATAYYALCIRGRLQKDHTVLIHCGAGGVGLAALRICEHRLSRPASQIFVTCGNESKRMFLHRSFGIPLSHIGDSRSSSFVDMVHRETRNEGVALVLNSLSGELVVASINCMSFGGIFLELGKTDLSSMEPSLTSCLRDHDKQIAMIDLDQLMAHKQAFEPVRKLVAEGLRNGEIVPLEQQVFSAPHEIDAAFDCMCSRDRMGKVLLKFDLEVTSPRVSVLSKNQVVIIVGGLGGFGLCLAHCLLRRLREVVGVVPRLILCSRSPATHQQQSILENLRFQFAAVIDARIGEFGQLEEVENLFSFLSEEQREVELLGIFNAAASTRDSLFDHMNTDDWKCPFEAKVQITRNFLHALSDSRFIDITSKLRYFVCFSSVVAQQGNVGQTNYACANAAMEQMVRNHAESTKSGLCIRLGLMPHVGLALSLDHASEASHLRPVAVTQVLTVLERLLDSDSYGVYSIYGPEGISRKRSDRPDLNKKETIGRILGIIRERAQIEHFQEDVPLEEQSFDSLTTTLLYNQLISEPGSGWMPQHTGSMFRLSPREIANSFAEHAALPILDEKILNESDSVVVVATIARSATSSRETLGDSVRRSLSSIKNQTFQPLRTFVVFEDQDVSEKIDQEVKVLLPEATVLHNQRTKTSQGSSSGTANTGIVCSCYEADLQDSCWIAFIDATNSIWQSSHLKDCISTAQENGPSCSWVLCGTGLDTNRNRLFSSNNKEFFAQPSNRSCWLVRRTMILQAGMFDEGLKDLADCDLAVRLCDVAASDEQDSIIRRAMTESLSVLNVDCAECVTEKSSRPTPDTVELDELYTFLYKHGERMTRHQWQYVTERVSSSNLRDMESILNLLSANLHGRHGQHDKLPLPMWDEAHAISVRRDIFDVLHNSTSLGDANECTSRGTKKMLVGITTSNMDRVSGLLSDLGCMLDDAKHVVIIFANDDKLDVASRVSHLLKKYEFRGHVTHSTDRIVQHLFCSNAECDTVNSQNRFPLPIAKARTVLQTFLYATSKAEQFEVVAILDDDARLPKTWGVQDGDEEVGDILLGRAIKTPPNPTLMSMRTQLLDFQFALDLDYFNSNGGDANIVPWNIANYPSPTVFDTLDDQYYDLSSSRWNHLEIPRYFPFTSDDDNFVEESRQRILVGDPLAREAVSTEHSISLQRGGCTVLFPKNFVLLVSEQTAPSVQLSSGRVVSSRRSDSFWVQKHAKFNNKRAVVRQHLSFLHDNIHDSIESPEKMREKVALEMIGAILCRPSKEREAFSKLRQISLQISIVRIQGICKSLRGRPYFASRHGLSSFVEYLEDLFENSTWWKEVYSVIDTQLAKLKHWEAHTEYDRAGVLKGFTLDVLEREFLKPCPSAVPFPAAAVLHDGPSLPVPCLHRIHEDAARLAGAHQIQYDIGMSVSVDEAEERLRKLAQLTKNVNLCKETMKTTKPAAVKALVTFDDGFRDVMMLRPIFRELSPWLQPVLFVLSHQLRNCSKQRHLPLTCLYEHCFKHEINPEDSKSLGKATRTVLKSLPQQKQYEMLEEAGIPIDLPTGELLSLKDLQALSNEGWWIGSHGPDHSDLNKAKMLDCFLERLREDFDCIREQGWTEWFAWPEGRWCARTADAVTRVCGATAQFGLQSPPLDELQHPSVISRAVWFGGNKKHRVLVTGSEGFLGKYLVLMLQGYGYDVYGYDLCHGQNILVEEEVRLELQSKKIQTCVHLAAVADLNDAEANPSQAKLLNIEGTRIVQSCCDQVGIRFLLASTCCVYGNNGISENFEDSPVAPTEIYASTKYEAEQIVLSSSRIHELHHVVMRLATFYGPGMRDSLATSVFLKSAAKKDPIFIHGTGNQTRCFTHVHDIAEGIRVIISTRNFSGIVNVADNREYSVNELAHIAMMCTGNYVQIKRQKDRPGQILRSKINNNRLRGLGRLGWRPTISLESGLRGCAVALGCAFGPVAAWTTSAPEPYQFQSMLHQAATVKAAIGRLERTCLPLEMGCDGVQCVSEELPDGTQIIVYMTQDLRTHSEVAVRIHSECFNGDVLGSLKCDCGPQLKAFLKELHDSAGLLAYVKGHEGRGAGLTIKTRAYADLDQTPTKHHNIALLDAGAEEIDIRCFDPAAELVVRMVLEEKDGCLMRETLLVLHTNNKDKFDALQKAISRRAERSVLRCKWQNIPADAHCNIHNRKYLTEKQRDNGQSGLSLASLPQTPAVDCTVATLPENVDPLPVKTVINSAVFDVANDHEGLLKFFSEHGFAVVSGVISREETDKMLASYGTILHEQFEEVKDCLDRSPLTFDEFSAGISQLRDVFLNKEHRIFSDLIHDDGPTSLSSLACQSMAVVDPDGKWQGIKLLHDHIISKRAGTNVSKKIPLHQDRMFWPVDIPACSTWTPLMDVPLNGGCLEILCLATKPHLNRQSVAPVDFMADELQNGMKLVLKDDPKPIRYLIPMKKGETLIFTSSAWHRSSPNHQRATDRVAFIQTWVHPCALWRPDLVPWHPVNEHLRDAGSVPGEQLAGKRHPTIFPSNMEKVSFTPKESINSVFARHESIIDAATKSASSEISMFDASDVVSTQIRNIIALRIGQINESSRLSLVEILKNPRHREDIVKATQDCLNLTEFNDESLQELRMESGCKSMADLLAWVLKQMMISAAAYSCHRSRNVFNSAYNAWWTLAGEKWNDHFVGSKFEEEYQLCRAETARFLKRIDVQLNNDCATDDGQLMLLRSIIRGCMAHIPFQNITMLTRVNAIPTDANDLEDYYCPPRLGDIINDMMAGIGGLCSVRNPFLYLLLKALNFENVRFISGTMCPQTGGELLGAHIALLVTVGHKDYWVDIANGFPYMDAIPLPSYRHDSVIIRHRFKDVKLVRRQKDGRDIFFVQHRDECYDKRWIDNYYFEAIAVDYSTGFNQMHQKHYNNRENFGPFLKNLRFNMWSETEGILLRNEDALVFSELRKIAPRVTRLDLWDASAFAKWIRSTPFAAAVEEKLIELGPEAWARSRKNQKLVREAESVTVTGGFFDNSAEAYIGIVTVWRDAETNTVQGLTFRKVRDYSPDILPVCNKGFAGGSWYKGELYVCWPNRIAVVSPEADWTITRHIDNILFNDLHDIHVCSHGVWVANTGVDSVDHLDFDGNLIQRICFGNTKRNSDTAEIDIRDQGSHTERRGQDKEHVNYVSSCSSSHLVKNYSKSKRVIQVGKDGQDGQPMHTVIQLRCESPPHEGFLDLETHFGHSPLVWNSTVDGFVVASDPASGEPYETWDLSSYCSIPRGWTRGLCLLDDGFLVGSTVIRGGAEDWLSKHGNKWNFPTHQSKTAISFVPYAKEKDCHTTSVHIMNSRYSKVFSLLRIPDEVRQTDDTPQ